jgi:hypothetical protein
MNHLQKSVNFLSLTFTHLISLLIFLWIGTDNKDWEYGTSLSPDIYNIFAATGGAFVSMHVISYYFKAHGSNAFRLKYAKIFILLICIGLYLEYTYRFLDRYFLHGMFRWEADTKIEKKVRPRTYVSHLTWAEYQSIALLVHANSDESYDIIRFPPIQSQATDIEYLDYEYPDGNKKTKYYFEISYTLPTEIGVQVPDASFKQQIDTIGATKRVRFLDGKLENH